MNIHRTATLPTDRDLGMSKTIPFFSNVIDLILHKETQRELKNLIYSAYKCFIYSVPKSIDQQTQSYLVIREHKIDDARPIYRKRATFRV